LVRAKGRGQRAPRLYPMPYALCPMPYALCPMPYALRESLPLHPRDDFLAHVLRRGLVAIEVHRVGRATLRARPEVGGVAEHLGQRHARGDDLRAAAILLRLNLAAAARSEEHTSELQSR